jgi:hypothetical protein
MLGVLVADSLSRFEARLPGVEAVAGVAAAEEEKVRLCDLGVGAGADLRRGIAAN